MDFSGLDDKLTVTNLVLAIALVAAGGLAGNYFMENDVETPETQSVVGDDDGNFEAVQPVQELMGFNDLDVTQQTLNETGMVDDANIVSAVNVNGTNGETVRYVLGLEVDDTVSNIEAEITPASDEVANSMSVEGVEVVRDDEDDISVAEAQAVATMTADQDDEVDESIGALSDGSYALVMEVRGVNAESLTTDQDLYSIALEGDGEDVEDVYATIDNVAAP